MTPWCNWFNNYKGQDICADFLEKQPGAERKLTPAIALRMTDAGCQT